MWAVNHQGDLMYFGNNSTGWAGIQFGQSGTPADNFWLHSPASSGRLDIYMGADAQTTTTH